ncbi:conserved Plasmodium protein, unknown function [Plasmodium sp. DRC-Itaito]|nr:conserved Plasmodium protein, unknown function [Plasmodium sp. DRC-Itaito]
MKEQKKINDLSYIQLKEPLSGHNNILNNDIPDENIKEKKKDERKIKKHSYDNISDSTNLSTNKYYINDSYKKEKKENDKIHKIIRHKIGIIFERIKKKKEKEKKENYTQVDNCNYNEYYNYLSNHENINIKNLNNNNIKNIYDNTKNKSTKKKYKTTDNNTIHLNKSYENKMFLYNIKNILNLNNDDINNLIEISNFIIDIDINTFYNTFIKNDNNCNNINILNYNVNHNKNIYDIKEYVKGKNEKVIKYKQNLSPYLGVSVCDISISESSYFLYNKNIKYKYIHSHNHSHSHTHNHIDSHHLKNKNYYNNKLNEKYPEGYTEINKQLYHQCLYNETPIIKNKLQKDNKQYHIKKEIYKENHQSKCFKEDYPDYYYHKKKKYIYNMDDYSINTNLYKYMKKKKNYKHNMVNQNKYKSTIINFFKHKFLKIKKKKKEKKKIHKTANDETIYIHKNIEQQGNYKNENCNIYTNHNINYEIKHDNNINNNYMYNNNMNNNMYENYPSRHNVNIKKKLGFILNKLFLKKSKEEKKNKCNIMQGHKNDPSYISNQYIDPNFKELYYIQMISVFNEPFSIYIKIYQIYIFSRKPKKNMNNFINNDICPNNIKNLTSNKENTNVSTYVLIDIQNNFLKYIIKKKIITEIKDCINNWEKYIIAHIQNMKGIHNDNYNNFISLSNLQIYNNNNNKNNDDDDDLIQHIINKIKYYLNNYLIPFFHKIFLSIIDYISRNYKNENLQYYFSHSSTKKKKKIQHFIYKTKNNLKNTYNNIFCKQKNNKYSIQNNNNQTYLNKELSHFFNPNKEKIYIFTYKTKTNLPNQYYYTLNDFIYEPPFYYLKSHNIVNNYIIYINSLYFIRLLLLYTFLSFFLLFLMILNMPICS